MTVGMMVQTISRGCCRGSGPAAVVAGLAPVAQDGEDDRGLRRTGRSPRRRRRRWCRDSRSGGPATSWVGQEERRPDVLERATSRAGRPGSAGAPRPRRRRTEHDRGDGPDRRARSSRPSSVASRRGRRPVAPAAGSSERPRIGERAPSAIIAEPARARRLPRPSRAVPCDDADDGPSSDSPVHAGLAGLGAARRPCLARLALAVARPRRRRPRPRRRLAASVQWSFDPLVQVPL